MDLDQQQPLQEAPGPPMNINNRCLPYAPDIAAAPDVTLAEINAGLRGVLDREEELDAALAAEEDAADAEEEEHGGHGGQGFGGGWNERGVGPHLKKLDTLLALKLRFDQRELGEFLQVAYKLMLSPRLSMRSQVRKGRRKPRLQCMRQSVDESIRLLAHTVEAAAQEQNGSPQKQYTR